MKGGSTQGESEMKQEKERKKVHVIHKRELLGYLHTPELLFHNA